MGNGEGAGRGSWLGTLHFRGNGLGVADEFKLSRVELSSGSGSESDAYLAAPRPGGNNGIACQRYGAGAHAVSALFACQLLQFRVRALALVQRYVLQVVHAGR